MICRRVFDTDFYGFEPVEVVEHVGRVPGLCAYVELYNMGYRVPSVGRQEIAALLTPGGNN